LNNYFISKGIKSTRIPILLDIKEISIKKKINRDKIKLLYAGSPGKKDYLKEIIDGLALLEKELLLKIEIQLLGVNKDELIKICKVSEQTIEKLRDSLILRGRVSREEVKLQLKESDFTVLLRSPKLRYAKAGFPTKVVESLATSTPVICNITSDLGDYLINEINSLIVKDCSAEAFKNTIVKAIYLSNDEKMNLSINARNTAIHQFDYKKFEHQFQTFIEEDLK
jgi:glycosyltransferase involved in cell wall biosynthesis